MAGMNSLPKAKYRYLRWGWFLLVVGDVLYAPSAIKNMIAMCSKDRWMIPLVPLILAIAFYFNFCWLKLWWRYQPSSNIHNSN